MNIEIVRIAYEHWLITTLFLGVNWLGLIVVAEALAKAYQHWKRP